MLFANPRILWLLPIVLPLLGLFFWWSLRKRRILTAQFIQTRLLASLTAGVSTAAPRIRMSLLLLAVAAAFLALARPLWGEASEELRQRGLDIVVAIDTSRSMLAQDVVPDRLERARLAAIDLLKLARSDRLGLVAFAGTAFLQCPLTLDEEAFRQSVNALEVGIIPQGGTALSEAIKASLTAFKEESGNHKVLILFTDGEDHEANAVETAERAARAGMRIFTVGVGTANGELLRIRGDKNQWEYLKDEQGNAVKSRLNEQLLTQIATDTDGFYIPLTSTDSMDVLYQRGLAPLPKQDLSTRTLRQHKEQFVWPLSLAILLLISEILWPDQRRRQSREPGNGPGLPESSTAVVGSAVLVLMLLSPVSAHASSSTAMEHYKRGEFQEALREYERLLQKRQSDARLHFNAGAAAYRDGQYEQAARHFTDAVTPDDLTLQQSAHYNLGNTYYRLGDQDPDPAKKSESWKQSVHNYESALKLNPGDPDSRHNLDFVKKKLEELQPPPDKSPQKDPKKESDENKEEQQKQDSSSDGSKEQQKQEEKRPDEPSKDSQEGAAPQEQQKQESQPEKRKEQPERKSDSTDAEDQKKQAGESKPSGPKPGEEEKQGDATQASGVPGQMTKEQVERLLDAQKGDEKAMIFQPQEKPRKGSKIIIKDW